MYSVLISLGLCLVMTIGEAAADARLKVVAAENFYGDIARQIGGDDVEVASILSSPDQDPHLFETTPSIIRKVSAAHVVVLNGADYDRWISQLVSAAPRAERTIIVAAQLLNKKQGDNPHLWYEPGTMPAVAQALAEAFTKDDPAHAAQYTSRLRAFSASIARLNEKIDEIRSKYAGVWVTATEPVFGYMASALGLEIRNEGFQLAAMNDTEPSARQIAAFERDLREHKVKVLLYNKQTSTKMTQRMLDIARNSHIPVVGVTETQPIGLSYQDWMLKQLDDLEQALAHSST
jgi:zinc/manganese transport system substrate-binding protein